MIKGAVSRAVEEMREDRVSGASAVTAKVVEIFLLYLGSTQRQERCYNDLRALAKALSASQLGMASVQNAAWMCAEGLKRVSWRGYEDFLQGFRASLTASADWITRRALAIFPPEATVLTLSYSHHVLRALRAARAAGVLSEVLLLESRPGLEGLALARDLEGVGVPRTLLVDAAGPGIVEAVDLVVTGCDALLADGSVVNKVGTLGLALAGSTYSVPVYCLCEALKVDPHHTLEGPPPLKEGPPEELVARPPPGTRVRNPYYDVTPARLFRGVVWEEGLVAPFELSRRFKGIPELLDYYRQPRPAPSGEPAGEQASKGLPRYPT